MEEARIIDLFYERSEQAVSELDRKYGAAVRKTAANILRDREDAEECVNDTYLGVWNSVPPHRPEPLGSYVCRIARNIAVSRLRANTAARRSGGVELVLDELAECIPASVDLEGELEARELLAAIERFLSTLSYDDRFLFVRRYWYADSVKEIAAAVHSRENRVAVRLFRLREKLQKFLMKEGLLV